MYSAPILSDGTNILHNGTNKLFGGRLRYGLKFESGSASSSIISVPYDSGLSFTDGFGNDSPFSISLIGRINSGNIFSGIIKGVSSSNIEIFADIGILFSDPSSSVVRLRLTNGNVNTNYISCEQIYSTRTEVNTLAHYIYTYDGSKSSSGLFIYRNKVSIGTQLSSGSYAGQTNSYNNIFIGRPNYSIGSSGQYNISSHKLYNKVLSESERNELFDSENQAKVAEGNLLWSYRMKRDLGDVNNIIDESGNGRHATKGSNVIWSDPYTEIAI